MHVQNVDLILIQKVKTMTEKHFKKLLGGRIVYSTMFKDCKTLKHDLIVYTIMNKYRAKGKDNWLSAEKTLIQLRLNNIQLRFTPYLNTIISRFYKIKKAIRDTKEELQLLE